MDMSEYKDLFISEVQEHLQAINNAVLQLEHNPDDASALESLFRSFHTIKGMSATMGYEDMSRLAHAVEDLLDRIRQGIARPGPALINLLFAGADVLTSLLADVTADRKSELDLTSLIQQFQSYEREGEEEPGVIEAGPALVLTAVTLSPDCVMKGVRAFMVLERLRELGQVTQIQPSEEDLAEERFDSTFTVVLSSRSSPITIRQRLENIAEVDRVEVSLLEEVKPTGPPPSIKPAPAIPSQSVRVSVRHLDLLLNLVGELVINRSRLWQIQHELEHPELGSVLSEHDRLLHNLRDAVLAVRLVPISQIFDRFPRMVRDLLKAQGKEATLLIEGQTLEVDRTILQGINEPLVHLLRNAVDHGLEMPAERIRQGKPRQGVIRLVARRERDQAVIEVSDDGRGMSPEFILRTAREKGILDEAQAQELSLNQIFMLITHPSFSTATRVTAVSGRGVGMVVVKRQVEALRGSLEIESEAGRGTTFRLRLPLTLAIIQALLVKVGGESYAIPLSFVDRAMELEPEMVQPLQHRQVLLSEETLPLVRLDRLLDVPPHPSARERSYVVVVSHGQRRVALLVDELLGKEEIVVKSFTGFMGTLEGLAGATILGDGRVVLILDIPNLLGSL